MPSTATDRLQGLTTSVAVKAPCRVATAAAIALSSLQTIDGVTLVAGDRVLVKNQADLTTNGIYTAAIGSWPRARDFDGTRDAVPGTTVFILEGSAPRTAWMVDGTSSEPVVIGSDEITFSENVFAGFYRTSIAFATWLQLDAITGILEGQSAVVFGDAGTHTDPVVGGTVDNEGVYGWSVAEEGWQRLANLEAADAATSAAAAHADRLLAAADAAATAADRVATHADVVLTHADVVLTHADAAATASDRTAVHADRLAAAADAATAAADAATAELAAMLASATVVKATKAELPAASSVANSTIAAVIFDESRNEQFVIYKEVADVWVYQGTVGQTAVYNSTLAEWFRTGVTGNAVAVVGDSVADQFFAAGNPPSYAIPHRTPGGEIPSVTFQNFGHSGVSTAAFISNATYINELISAYAITPFHLIYWGYGINGTRTGSYANAAAFAADQILGINLVRGTFPGVPIIMCVPSSFLTNDVTGSGFIVPNGSAQAYSDIMEAGYLLCKGLWPDVVIQNTRERIFTGTCVAGTTVDQRNAALMTDQIHMSGAGQSWRLQDLVNNFIGKSLTARPSTTVWQFADMAPQGFPKFYNIAKANRAVLDQGVLLAPTEYPEIVYGEDYEQISIGVCGSIGANSAGFSISALPNGTLPAFSQDGDNLRQNDAMVQFAPTGTICFLAPASSGGRNNGNITANFDAFGTPFASVASATAHLFGIYRHKYANSALAKTYAQRRKSYPVRAPFAVSSAASGSLVLVQAKGGPHPSQWQHRSTDIIVIGETAFPLIGAQFTASISGDVLTVSAISGSFGAIVAGQTITAANSALTAGVMQGTTILAFGTGGTTGTGGTGTYKLSNSHASAVSSTTFQSVATYSMTSTGNRQIDLPGTDFSTVSGILDAMAFGTGETRAATNEPESIQILESRNVVTAGTGSTLKYVPTRYTIFNVNRFRLTSPDAANATTVLVKTTLNGTLTTVATLVFPANGTIPQVTYNPLAGAVPVCDGVELQAVCSGAGTSGGLDLKFDTRI